MKNRLTHPNMYLKKLFVHRKRTDNIFNISLLTNKTKINYGAYTFEVVNLFTKQ